MKTRQEAYRAALIRNGQRIYDAPRDEIEYWSCYFRAWNDHGKEAARYPKGGGGIRTSNLRCYHVDYGDGGRCGEFKITPRGISE